MTNLPITGDFMITATYGQKGKNWANGHQGIDFVAPDHRIFATCTGTVRLVAYDEGGWGNYISIGDDAGRRHIFCHLAEVYVKQGQKVDRTTVIGKMGSTGNSTGTHLHYQLQQGTVVIDPTLWLGVPNKAGEYDSADFQIEEMNKVAFKDFDKVPKWAKEEKIVEKAVTAGIVEGDANGNLRPNDTPTRIEVLAMIVRAKEL